MASGFSPVKEVQPEEHKRVTEVTYLRVVCGTLAGTSRSEEHTSELQSRQYLVCRLLLEKKKRRGHGQPIGLYPRRLPDAETRDRRYVRQCAQRRESVQRTSDDHHQVQQVPSQGRAGS